MASRIWCSYRMFETLKQYSSTHPVYVGKRSWWGTTIFRCFGEHERYTKFPTNVQYKNDKFLKLSPPVSHAFMKYITNQRNYIIWRMCAKPHGYSNTTPTENNCEHQPGNKTVFGFCIIAILKEHYWLHRSFADPSRYWDIYQTNPTNMLRYAKYSWNNFSQSVKVSLTMSKSQ